MTSTPSLSRTAHRPSRSTSPFAKIWSDALDRYQARTDHNLRDETTEETRRLAGCNSSESLQAALTDMMESLASARRVPARWKAAQSTLHTLLDIFLVFNDAAAELAASLQVPGGKAIFVAVGVLLKATKGMRERLDDLEKLFDGLSQFLRRFQLLQAAPNVVLDEHVFVPIFAELLNILGLATKILKRPSLHNFWRALKGDTDIKGAIERLERACKNEDRMTFTRTYLAINQGFLKLNDRFDAVFMETSRFSQEFRKLNDRFDVVFKETRYLGQEVAELRAELRQRFNEWDGRVQVHIESQPRSNAPIPGIPLQHHAAPAPAEPDALGHTHIQQPYSPMTSTQPAAGVSTPIEWTLNFADPTTRLAIVTILAQAWLPSQFVVLAAAWVLWKSAIPRPLDPTDTVVLIDVQGGRISLSLDRCTTFEAFHDTLLKLFNDPAKPAYRAALNYVRRRRYAIEDARNSAAIARTTWYMRAGMEVEIAVIIRRAAHGFIMCPWCGKTVASREKAAENSLLKCTNGQCNHIFSMSSATVEYGARRDPSESTPGPLLDGSSEIPEHEVDAQPGAEIPSLYQEHHSHEQVANPTSHQGNRAYSSIKHFRKVHIECAWSQHPNLLPEMSFSDIFEYIPNMLRNDPQFGPFVKQSIYRPSTAQDLKRYIEDVALQQEPIYFFQATARGWELDKARLTKGKQTPLLLGASEKVLEDSGPSISVRLKWQGYESFCRQISSRDYSRQRGPITLAKLGYEIYKVLFKFFEFNKDKPVDVEVGDSWDLRRFCPEDFVLVSLHQVSAGSWQPHLRLRHPLESYGPLQGS